MCRKPEIRFLVGQCSHMGDHSQWCMACCSMEYEGTGGTPDLKIGLNVVETGPFGSMKPSFAHS